MEEVKIICVCCKKSFLGKRVEKQKKDPDPINEREKQKILLFLDRLFSVTKDYESNFVLGCYEFYDQNNFLTKKQMNVLQEIYNRCDYSFDVTL